MHNLIERNKILAPDGGIALLLSPADVVKSTFDQLAPAFTHAVVEIREIVNRQGSGPLKCPFDILLEVTRAHLARCDCLKHHAAVPKRASRKRVAIKENVLTREV
jgi:hypothetical protein